MLKNVSKNVYICVMKVHFKKYKGIHPGLVLRRELEKRSIRQRTFAREISCYPQTLNAITKGKRNLPVAMALRIEDKLGIEEGTFTLLQAYYDIHTERLKQQSTPDLRKSLFWDTRFESIDWEKEYKAVIRRVFDYGTEEEKAVIRRFYGMSKVNQVLKARTTSLYSSSGRKQ